MEWTRNETLALASQSCAQCQGLGLRTIQDLKPESQRVAQPCGCVLRNIFRACYTKFRDCATKEKSISRVTLEAVQGRDHKGTWSRKDEEYVADFCLITRRSLSQFEYNVFKYHFLLGADWKLCCRKLDIDRGNFFHTVYRIQQKLGRIFRELQPYGLYPVSEYFHGEQKTVAASHTGVRKVIPIRPPLAQPSSTLEPELKAA